MIKRSSPGFTIVELLIVIVVIGILAAITIIAFNGAQERAIAASLQSDLKNAKSQLMQIAVTEGAYPANSTNLRASNGSSFSAYQPNNTANPQTFCLEATNGTRTYYITESIAPTEGACPSQSRTIAWQQTSANLTVGGFQWDDGAISDDGQTIILTHYAYSYLSTNGGQTWTEGPWRSGGKAVAMSRDGQRIVIVGENSSNTNYSKLRYTLNRGASWTEINIPTNLSDYTTNLIGMTDDANIITLYKDGTSGNAIRTTDRGVNWTSIPNSTFSNPNGAYSIGFSNDGQHVYQLPLNNQISKTNDRFATRTTSPAPSGQSFGSIRANSTGALVMTASSHHTNPVLHVSRDYGVTWQQTGRLAQNNTIQNFSMSDDGTIIVGHDWNGRLVTSTNSGTDWEYVSVPAISTLEYPDTRTIRMSANGEHILLMPHNMNAYKGTLQ